MGKLNLRDLINIANEVAIENFQQQSFNFKSLWAKTWTKAKDFKKDSIENWIGPFYLELLCDPRFVYVGNSMWKLREFMDYGEYLKAMGKRAQKISFSEKDIEGEDASVDDSSDSSEKTGSEEDGIVEDLEGEEGSDSSESEEDSINEEIDGEGDNYGRVKSNDEDDEESYE